MGKDQLKRAVWHDYKSPCRYMITLMKNPVFSDSFSSIGISNPTLPPSPQNTYTRWSKIGKAISDRLYHMPSHFPSLVVEQYSVMPDHVHFLLCVKNYLPEHLGNYIARFKNAINEFAQTNGVFMEGYNDQILKPSRSLDALFRYIRENPYRLAIRRQYPDFFTRRNNLTINGVACCAYGNIQLLDNPFKEQVIVHRTDSDETFSRNRDIWLHTAANGGVLVSPFVSRREKAIRDLSEEVNGKFIFITEKPFGEREKPVGKDFILCSQGRALIISPYEPIPFDRKGCMKMNSIAEAICRG